MWYCRSKFAIKQTLNMAAKVPRNFRLLEELEKGEKGLGAGISSMNLFTRREIAAQTFPLTTHDSILNTEACSYGLDDPEDLLMSNWNGTILGPPHVRKRRFSSKNTKDFKMLSLTLMAQSVHENRIYSVKMHCGKDYPDKPPEIWFRTRVNLPGVDNSTGKVDRRHIRCLAEWKRENTMETILIELRR